MIDVARLRSPSLRSSVVAGLLLVMTLMSLGFLYATRAAFDQLEFELLDQRLANELLEFEDAYAHDPTIPPVNWGGLRRYVHLPGQESGIPHALRGITPQQPQRISLDDHEFLAGSVVVGEARLYVTLDVAKVQNIEDSLIERMILSLFLGYALALALSWIVVTRVSRPLALLAQRVADAEPIRAQIASPTAAAPREVGEITEAFNQFMRRMAAFVERERAFTDDAGHELRTPIAVIASTVELMRQQPHRSATETEQLKRIHRATTQMESLVESFLLLAREEGAAPPSKIDASAVIHDTLSTLKEARPQDAHRLIAAIEAPCWVRAPAAVLNAVVGNLVLNALSHTEGRVWITLDNRILSVRDEGRGIDAPALDQIFERHIRGAESSGHGLGLFLVRRICSHLGWALRAESRRGEGSRFEVSFKGDFTESLRKPNA